MTAATTAPTAPRRRPIFGSLAGYQRRWLRGDAVAGLTVWAVLGLGAANLTSGLVTGMVVNGSLSKTAVTARPAPALRCPASSSPS
jgi:MFS superfamily sulfate permease-like transporter